MGVHTRGQRLAQAAYRQVNCRLITDEKGKKRLDEKYESFARKFPALIHTCGLAQAVASALAKKEADYIADLTEVLRAAGHFKITGGESLDDHARTQPLSGYLRLSRDAINAASWLKRYVEAAEEE